MRFIARFRRSIIVPYAIWGLMTCVGIGQTPDSAALRGEVTGPNGVGIAGVSLKIEDAHQRVIRELRTGQHGVFAAEDLMRSTA